MTKRNAPPTLEKVLSDRGALTRVARQVGISRSHLSDIKHGRRRPSGDLAFKLEDATGVPARALLTKAS